MVFEGLTPPLEGCAEVRGSHEQKHRQDQKFRAQSENRSRLKFSSEIEIFELGDQNAVKSERLDQKKRPSGRDHFFSIFGPSGHIRIRKRVAVTAVHSGEGMLLCRELLPNRRNNKGGQERLNNSNPERQKLTN